MTVLTDAPSAAGRGAPGAPGPVIWAAATVAVMPFPLIVHDFSRHDGGFDYLTILLPVDILLIVLAAAAAPAVWRDVKARQFGAGWTGWLVLSGVLSVAWVAHPSSRGIHTLLEMLGVVAISHTLATSPARYQRALIATVGVMAAIEALWSTAQRVSRSWLGAGFLGESTNPFHQFSPGVVAPQGTMEHIYILAGLGLVGAALLAAVALSSSITRRWPWTVAAAAAAVPVGLTYSRAGLAGLVALVGAIAIAGRPRRRARAIAAAVLLGALIPAAVWSTGWRERETQTVTASTASGLTTQRDRLDHEAVQLIRSNPWFGVGPGLYVITLHQRFGRESDPVVRVFKPVHDVPLLVTAEGGVIAGAIVIAMLARLGWRARASGAAAVALYGAYLPFFVLDQFGYWFPQGVVLTGLWLGGLDALARHRGQT